MFVPTSAPTATRRWPYRFSLMLFEDIRWDWNADQVRISRPLLLGRALRRPQGTGAGSILL